MTKLLSFTACFIIFLPSLAHCFPRGTWTGTGSAVLDDGKTYTCERIVLQIQEFNGDEYDFETSSRGETPTACDCET